MHRLERVSRTLRLWNPHDYVPWELGSNYPEVGGRDWSTGQSGLSEVARVAMITNLLTEDNLPSYHREIAMNFSMDGAWGTWVNRWTVEENRHGIALRDYLVVTRAVDPVALERDRLQQVTTGFSPRRNAITMAVGGIYDLRQHLDDVVMPVLRKWRVFERNDLGAAGERRRDEIAAIIPADQRRGGEVRAVQRPLSGT